MSERPTYLVRGEKARLFPVLSETSREGRTTSIVLSCLAHIHEFSRAMLLTVGQRAGAWARIECYTEVCFPNAENPKDDRPDGLIVVKANSKANAKEWRALIEAKVGNSELSVDQVERYLEIAKRNQLDSVITISNQFAPSPSHHPLTLSKRSLGKVEVYHWSWMHILTQAELLLGNDEIADPDQRAILLELVRFLSHDSTGVKGFDSMPPAWTELVQLVSTGGAISPRSPVAKEVLEAWYQEVRDLSLILSRRIGVYVQTRMPRAHRADAQARLKADLDILAKERVLQAAWEIKDAVAPLDVCADIQTRTITASMKLRAPSDRARTRSPVNWLLRQIQNTEADDVVVRLHWSGPGSHTQHPLSVLREDPDLAAKERPNGQLHTFEICLIRNIAGRFGQRKNFIIDLEKLVPEFYERVGQRLKAWQAPAPRVRETRSATVDDIEAEAEEAAMDNLSPASE